MNENSKEPHRKHRVTFPNLKQILDLLTTRAIMTPRNKFFLCHPDQNVSDAKRLLRKNKFSGAPLKEEKINRYVKLEKVEQCAGHIKYCKEVADEIAAKDTIAEATTIENLIEIFAKRKDPSPLFVTKDNSIIGLITGADLDKIAVKVHFFVLISALESLLLEIIGNNYRKYRNYLEHPRNVEKRYRKCKGELIGLDEHYYLLTREIFEIVWKSDIKTRMNVRTEDELVKLGEFRNKVAHGNYIIVKDDDIKDLKKIHDKICEYIRTLESSSYFASNSESRKSA